MRCGKQLVGHGDIEVFVLFFHEKRGFVYDLSANVRIIFEMAKNVALFFDLRQKTALFAQTTAKKPLRETINALPLQRELHRKGAEEWRHQDNILG